MATETAFIWKLPARRDLVFFGNAVRGTKRSVAGFSVCLFAFFGYAWKGKKASPRGRVGAC